MSTLQNIRLREIIEFIGVASIVASLIFVGYQLRQDRLIAEGEIYQSRTDAALTIQQSVLESEVALEAFAKLRQEGFESLSPVQVEAINREVIMLLLSADNNHQQYQLGLISEEYYESALKRLKNRLSNHYVRRVFEVSIQNMRPSFASVIESLLAEIDAAGT
jgi:hypothetical protein